MVAQNARLWVVSCNGWETKAYASEPARAAFDGLRNLASQPARKASGGAGYLYATPAKPAERRAYNPKTAARLELEVRQATAAETAAHIEAKGLKLGPGSAMAKQAERALAPAGVP